MHELFIVFVEICVAVCVFVGTVAFIAWLIVKGGLEK